MKILNEKVGRLYLGMLAASLGSALISSIYSLVDMAMIGQYQGPSGPAALAVVAPIWNIIYSLGLLMGIGGSVLFSALRGESAANTRQSNEVFTASLIGALSLALICWVGLAFFSGPLLTAFGADASILALAENYLTPIKFVVPCFLMNQFLAAYLRNDNSASLAAWAVLGGGIFNVFGDWFFIFACDMGMFGAGLATGMGALVSTLLMLSHFLLKKNTLAIVKVNHLFARLRSIVISGFSTFFSDVAMGILTILFNRQILTWLGADALSVYAIIINISTIVQCFGYSIGQASQPIISAAYGAGMTDRIRGCLKYAIMTALVFGIGWMLLGSQFQTFFIYLFMKPTESILKIGPSIIAAYSLSFILLPLNIFSSYYFQAIMKPGSAFLISLLRGALISSGLILALPMVISPDALWYAMPITELVVSAVAIALIIRYTR